jgi:hypothetical protein
VIEIAETVRGVVPVLVSVTVCAELDVPCCWLEKLSTVGESVAGGGGVAEVPVIPDLKKINLIGVERKMPFVEKRSILPADGCSRRVIFPRVFFDVISAAVTVRFPWPEV